MYAARNGYKSVVMLLLNAGADKEAKSNVRSAAGRGYSNIAVPAAVRVG